METATLRIRTENPDPAELRGCFAALFASLDERPRRVAVDAEVSRRGGPRVSIGLEHGEPVFEVEGKAPAKAKFRGRWLACHPVPWRFPRSGRATFVAEPAGGNRVRIRPPRLAERKPFRFLDALFAMLQKKNEEKEGEGT